MSLVALLERWCAQNSGSHHAAGLASMRAILAKAFASALGVQPQGVGSALILRKRPEAARRVLLSGHMDTVFAPDSPFQSCRHQPDGTLCGPGVIDMKGGLVVMLEALRRFERSAQAPTLGWTVLITADEEIGSTASRALLEAEARAHDLGLVFEGSLPDGAIIGTRKGGGEFVATVHGRAAHTGRDPENGRNAIVLLAELIAALEGLPAAFPGLTINVGRIAGGGASNIVPDLATATWNLRLPADLDVAAVEAALEATLAPFHEREGFRITWEGGFARPPLGHSPKREHLLRRYLDCAARHGRPTTLRDTGGSSDGNLLFAAGLPVLDGIGPRGGHLHSDREFIHPESLEEQAGLIAAFLSELAADPL